MTAFRNTGIEGGYVSLATQNWLLNMRRSNTRAARVTGEKTPQYHRTGKSLGPPVKVITNPFPKFTHTAPLKAALLAYENEPAPANHGNWNTNTKLEKAGLLRMTQPPHTKHTDGTGEYWYGALFVITEAGRAYLAQLKSR